MESTTSVCDCADVLDPLVVLGREMVKLCLSLILRLCASKIGTRVPRCSTYSVYEVGCLDDR